MGKKRFTRPNNVRDFQKWVLNVKRDKVILGKYGADGDWGTNTINAWNKYGNEYLESSDNNISEVNLDWLNKVTPQIREQVKYLQSVEFDEAFTILDDKNSTVYAVNDDYTLHKSYPVITGRDRGDEQKTISFGQWFRNDFLTNISDISLKSGVEQGFNPSNFNSYFPINVKSRNDVLDFKVDIDKLKKDILDSTKEIL
jgi:hypothetical protein